MRIDIQTISHNSQRYDTLGDYWWSKDGNTLHIRISDLPDERMEYAIAIHELVEALICKWLRIYEPEIKMFDEKYEKDRPKGNDEEPGDDPRAPYHLQHGLATAAERIYCAAVGLNWKIYTDACLKLVYKPKRKVR